MGVRENYRLNEAILSIYSDDSHHLVPVMVPSGSIVTPVEGILDDLTFVDVLWQRRTVMMFTVDLRNRATPISNFAKHAALGR